MASKAKTKAELFREVLDYFQDENRGWCQGNMLSGQSACLVGGVRAVVGAAYTKPSGKLFLSRDEKKWRLADELLLDLHEIQFPEHYSTRAFTAADDVTDDYLGQAGSLRVPSHTLAKEALIDFNDRDRLTITEEARVNAAVDKLYEAGRKAGNFATYDDDLDKAIGPIRKRGEVRAKREVLKLVQKAAKQAEKAGV